MGGEAVQIDEVVDIVGADQDLAVDHIVEEEETDQDMDPNVDEGQGEDRQEIERVEVGVPLQLVQMGIIDRENPTIADRIGNIKYFLLILTFFLCKNYT